MEIKFKLNHFLSLRTIKKKTNQLGILLYQIPSIELKKKNQKFNMDFYLTPKY